MLLTGTLDGLTVTGSLAYASAAIWTSGLQAQSVGLPPTRPPYSLFKGSLPSLLVEPSPWDPATRALRLINSDAEASAATPPGRTPASASHNPGVAACGPQNEFGEGDDAWIRWRIWLPANFPAFIPNTFLLLGELHGPVVNAAGAQLWPAGPPFSTSTSIGASPATALAIDLVGGVESLCMKRGTPPNFDAIWHVPLKRAALTDVVFHVVFSSDPTLGRREVWLNGVRQMFVGGQTTLIDQTLRRVPAASPIFPAAFWGASERLTAFQMLYFTLGRYQPATAWQGDMVIGNSLASVS